MRGGFPSCSGPRGECGGSDRATNRWIDTDCGPRPWKERANQITGGRGIYLTGPVSCGNLRPRIKRTAGRQPRLFERDLGNCAASKTPGTERRRPFSFIFYFSQSSNTLPSHPSPWNRGRKKNVRDISRRHAINSSVPCSRPVVSPLCVVRSRGN